MTHKSGLKLINFEDSNNEFSSRIKKDLTINTMDRLNKIEKELNTVVENRNEWLMIYHKYLVKVI